tara:strand:- start:7458 stop:7784 length:327 start_codon:yes stop_codon:yes gene_type:complete
VSVTNTSGIQPVDTKVLILPDEVKDKIGNIYVTARHVEQQQASAVKGTFIAGGRLAFADWKDDKDVLQPGDRVLFSKYAGQVTPAADGKEYRLCQDTDIAALLTEEAS